MKKLFTILTFVTLSLSFVGYIPEAHACSCIQPEGPVESLGKAKAVFTGTVTKIDKPALIQSSLDKLRVTFDVARAWKGISTDPVTVSTVESSASCGFNFEEGKEYIVYAYDDKGDTSVSLCSRTALLADAAGDVTALGEGRSFDAAGGVTAEDPNNFYRLLASGGVLLVVFVCIYLFSKGWGIQDVHKP